MAMTNIFGVRRTVNVANGGFIDEDATLSVSMHMGKLTMEYRTPTGQVIKFEYPEAQTAQLYAFINAYINEGY